jgi:hypothetical protein
MLKNLAVHFDLNHASSDNGTRYPCLNAPPAQNHDKHKQRYGAYNKGSGRAPLAGHMLALCHDPDALRRDA